MKLPSQEEIIKKGGIFQKDIFRSMVYFLFSNGKIVYVGKSKHGIARIVSHNADKHKKFDSFCFINCKERLLVKTEYAYIDKFKPIYNCDRHNYNGPLVVQRQLFQKSRSLNVAIKIRNKDNKKKTTTMKFQVALKRYMKKRKLSANAAAKELGTTRRGLLYWKSGAHQPPKEKRERLMKGMGI